MQSEMHCEQTVESGCPAEHNSKVHQDLTHCHHSNRRASDGSQPSNDVGIYIHNRNVNPYNDITDASNCVTCCCAGAEVLARSQAVCPKQDAEYLEVVASDADDNGAYGDSKPPNCQSNCRNQHDDNYLQLVSYDDYLQLITSEDYLQIVAYDHYTQLVVNDDCHPQVANDDYLQLIANEDYIQQVRLNFRYCGMCNNDHYTSPSSKCSSRNSRC
jgi:hypothetical protein